MVFILGIDLSFAFKHRALVVPLPTKSGSEAEKGDNQVDCKRKRSRSMTWAQRLKRVFWKGYWGINEIKGQWEALGGWHVY